ncbi:lipopolysaccharide biosynthesis protein [Streptomyces sp. NPDC087440]|uniref:lipopolysaccharide biosynthesis protein n=1 Tax=Streptomyces sp. NPDC087440 TaxID=3365790 RepID=UPI003811548D
MSGTPPGGPAAPARAAAGTEGRPGARALVGGFGWETGALAAALLVQLCYTAYTGRHVSAEHFGAYAIALNLVHVCASTMVGFTQLVLKSRELTEEFLGLALLTAAVAGVGSCALLQLAAPVCGVLWPDVPELVAFVRVLLLQNAVFPLSFVCASALRRSGRNRAAAVLEFGGQCTGFAAAVLLLTTGWNPLGIAVTLSVSAVVQTVGGLALLRPRLGGLRWGGAALGGELWLCTRSAVLQSVMYGVPMWTAGLTLGPAVTGHYSRAVYFASMAPMMLVQGLGRVVTPAVARCVAAGRSPLPALGAALSAASALLACVLGVLAALGPTVLVVLLGPGWEEAGALVPWFLPGLGLQVLCMLGNQGDEARGEHAGVWRDQLLVAGVMVAGCLVGGVLASPHVLGLAHLAATLAGHAGQLRRWGMGLMWRTYGVHGLLGVWVSACTAAAAVGGPGLRLVSGCLGALLALLPLCLAPVGHRIPALRTAWERGLPVPRVGGRSAP